MGYLIGHGRYGRETYPTRGGGGGGGAAVPPWSTTKIVDPDTAVPPANQDGSVGAPYSTIQAAINANLGALLVLELVGDVYPENVVIPAGTPVGLICAYNGIATITLDPSATLAVLSGGLTVGDFTMGDGAQFSAAAPITINGPAVIGDNCNFASFVSLGVGGTFVFGDNFNFRCFNEYSFTNLAGIAATPGATPSALTFMGSATGNSAQNSPRAPGIDAPGSTVVIVGGSNNTGVGYTCGSLTIDNCDVTGGNPTLTCDTFNCNSSTAAFGAVVTTGPVQITNSKVSSSAPPWANALAAPFVVDAYSNYWLKTSGTTLANLGAKVIANDLVP